MKPWTSARWARKGRKLGGPPWSDIARKAAPREIAESSTQTSRQTKISAVTKLQDSCRDMFCKKQLHRCSESRKRTPKASTNEHGIVQESLTSKGMIRSHAANGKEIARRNPSKWTGQQMMQPCPETLPTDNLWILLGRNKHFESNPIYTYKNDAWCLLRSVVC